MRATSSFIEMLFRLLVHGTRSMPLAFDVRLMLRRNIKIQHTQHIISIFTTKIGFDPKKYWKMIQSVNKIQSKLHILSLCKDVLEKLPQKFTTKQTRGIISTTTV